MVDFSNFIAPEFELEQEAGDLVLAHIHALA